MEVSDLNNKYIAQASTQEEAIQKGLDALNITREEAEITVQEPGKKGFLGFGQRDAVVIVERKEKRDLVSDLLKPMTPIREEKIAVEKEIIKEPVVEEVAVEETIEVVEEPTAEEQSVEPAEKAPVEEPEVSAEEVEAQDQEAIEGIAQYLTEIVHGMDVTDAEVFISRIDNVITYDIETESAGLVIGRHGRVLNGLQVLAQNHMHQLAHSKFFVKVDCEKYRERRKSTVEKLAERTAEKVVETGRKVSLNPMPAHERKQIHRYLNQFIGVQTHSEGKEPHRYLVVEPLDDEE